MNWHPIQRIASFSFCVLLCRNQHWGSAIDESTGSLDTLLI